MSLLALRTVESHWQRAFLPSLSANSLPKNLRKPSNRVRQLSCEGTNAHGSSSLS